MFFLLSKILDFLISPLNWIVIFLLLAFFQKNAAQKKRFLRISLIVLLFFTNPLILNCVMGWWEIPSTKIENIKQTYEGGIMLGGTIRYFNSSLDRPVYGEGVDRFLQVTELYNQKKIKKIIITSGSGSLVYTKVKEGDLLRNQLLRMNIDSNDVIAESNSRNTFENAKFTAEIIKQQNLNGPFILVTSAFHMRRSLLCFKKAGVDVVPFPVGQHSGKIVLTPDKIILPSIEVLLGWNLLMHEWAGMVTYKMMGYI